MTPRPDKLTVTDRDSFASWRRSGEPWIWSTAGAVAICLLLVGGLLALIAVRGLAHFWPADVVVASYQVPGEAPMPAVGEMVRSEAVSAARLAAAGLPVEDRQALYSRSLLKVGNRDLYGSDFRYVIDEWLVERSHPPELTVLERVEWGNFYGWIVAVKEAGTMVADGDAAWTEFRQRLARADGLREQILEIEKSDIAEINHGLERARLERRALALKGRDTERRLRRISQRESELRQGFAAIEERLVALQGQIGRDSITVRDMGGRELDIPLSKIVRGYRPNAMGLFGKLGHYGDKLWEFVSDDPREANTEGGIFPAIFGTVMMVMLMSVFVTPFGVVAALYLREYATQGLMTRTIRIAVNNLAGVPSIVYGVFGLGFFVYFMGGSIDALFYPEALPSPTFGTGGLLWASLTLALLTLPVVIVATEEGLARIPRSLREASLALGATRAETLWRVVLPMSSPAMMTGLILAVARAAGEVAPLMLVGVVKLAPSLPLDGNAPFLHLDRKLMHLGFHIYDVGFQSPNVEAARPLVYATALLLVLVIIALNLFAVRVRNRLRERYRALEH